MTQQLAFDLALIVEEVDVVGSDLFAELVDLLFLSVNHFFGLSRAARERLLYSRMLKLKGRHALGEVLELLARRP